MHLSQEEKTAAVADFIHKWGTTESVESAVDVLVKAYEHYMDGVIDFIGLAPVIKRSHLMLHICRTLMLVGISGNEMPEMTLNSVIRRNVTLKGVIVGNYRQSLELLELVRQGKVRSPQIRHIRLMDIPHTLEKLDKGTIKECDVIKM